MMSKWSPAMVGWFQAFFTVVVLWGITNVYLGFSSSVVGVNSLVFSCCAFLSSALGLLLIAGRGPLGRETLKSASTWLYGFILIFGYIVLLNLYATVTTSEGTLLFQLSIVVAFFASWAIAKRKPTKEQYIGSVPILAGIGLVLWGIPSEKLKLVYFLMCATSFLLVLRVLLAEVHPQSNKAGESGSVRSQCRVVGLVMLVSSLLFLLFAFIVAYLDVNSFIPSKLVPTLADFHHKPTIYMGFICGLFLVAPIRFLEFTSARAIKSENVLAVGSLAPLSTYYWENIASYIPFLHISVKDISNLDLLAGALVTMGAMYIAFGRIYRELKSSGGITLTEYVTNADQLKEMDDDMWLEEERKRTEAAYAQIDKERKDRLSKKRKEGSNIRNMREYAKKLDTEN